MDIPRYRTGEHPREGDQVNFWCQILERTAEGVLTDLRGDLELAVVRVAELAACALVHIDDLTLVSRAVRVGGLEELVEDLEG
jgi:hypothetical protein